MNKLTIISRKSILAKLQAIEVSEVIKKKYPEIKIIFKTKDTSGDVDLTTPLHKMPEMGVFTSDIREELLSGKADIAVHSWKDLPVDLEEGTEVAATIKRADPRDVLIFKKSSFKKKKLEIFTSSPRRQENLSKFLKKAFPFEINSFSFSDIRGNILTRVQKLKDSNADGLVIAKAALDRLLSPIEEITTELDSFKKDLDEFLWMVIPCSQNPCAPGQGALAVEIKSGNKEVIELLNEINDLDVFKDVEDERKKLKKYGGGCHQKIGVSYEKRDFGDVLTLKGITDDNISLNQRKIERKEEGKNSWYNIDLNKIYPSDLKNYNFFSRNNLKDHIEEISSLRNKNILASRANVLDGKIKIDSSNILWSSGVKTWFQLVKKGYWVNGSFDSLGENEENLKFISNNDWVKLTHKDSLDFFINDRLFTYRLTKNKINEDLSKKTHFYWMSGSAFEYAIEQFPIILEKFHSCGPGNTYEIIKKNVTEDRIKIFLNYEDWKDEITNEKS